MRKVALGSMNNAIIAGNVVGMPRGILNASSIPVYTRRAGRPPSWQKLAAHQIRTAHPVA
ncbi:MAG: hypothetical protein JO283_20685 [Bradyrhizobium sp.]|nr:hypothetical protein [Bradyrhizobium sp.]